MRIKFVLALLVFLTLPACENISNNEKNKIPDVNYTIILRENVNSSSKTRTRNRIVINTENTPSETDMKTIANDYWKKYYEQEDELHLFIYLPGMDTEDIAYGVAIFSSSGLVDFEVNEYVLDF
jgi:hypothetical protein